MTSTYSCSSLGTSCNTWVRWAVGLVLVIILIGLVAGAVAVIVMRVPRDPTMTLPPLPMPLKNLPASISMCSRSEGIHTGPRSRLNAGLATRWRSNVAKTPGIILAL